MSTNIIDIIISLFLGIVAVMIFVKLFDDTRCIIVQGPIVDKLSKTIVKNKNKCHQLALKQVNCTCINN